VAVTLIKGGAQLETVTLAEFSAFMDKRERDRARGVKWVEFAVPFNGFPLAPASAPTSVLTEGPEEGYAWSVKILSTTLASAGTLLIYKASSSGQTSRLVGTQQTSQTGQVQYWAANQCFLQHGTALYLLATQGLTNYYIGAEQAIAEQAWKVFD
jgi:hypothetical protein